MKVWIGMFVSLSCLVVAISILVGRGRDEDQEVMAEDLKRSDAPPITDLEIIVAYDNYPHTDGLKTGWGFSCVVRGPGKTILFDTGGDGAVLLSNMEKLQIDPKEIDAVVLSHIHMDHVGGLGCFLAENADVIVYVPRSFPDGLKQAVRTAGAKTVDVHGPVEICGSVYSTGELGTGLKEQSLIVRTDKGLIVITGCAHPGIVKIVRRAADLLREDVLFVMGGFHLGGASQREMESILSSFRKAKVHRVGPCHCTGDGPIGMFAEQFGPDFVRVGVGRTIRMADLQ